MEMAIDDISLLLSGSLHDELINPHVKMKSIRDLSMPPLSDDKQPSALASRPCYRCIFHMASFGIEQAFWTTDNGTWASTRVRDSVDMLAQLGERPRSDATTALSSVFVTKHEVLRLRRRVGGS